MGLVRVAGHPIPHGPEGSGILHWDVKGPCRQCGHSDAAAAAAPPAPTRNAVIEGRATGVAPSVGPHTTPFWHHFWVRRAQTGGGGVGGGVGEGRWARRGQGTRPSSG